MPAVNAIVREAEVCSLSCFVHKKPRKSFLLYTRTFIHESADSLLVLLAASIFVN